MNRRSFAWACVAMSMSIAMSPVATFAQPKQPVPAKPLSPEKRVEASIRKALEHPVQWNGTVGNLVTGAVIVDRDGSLLQHGDLGAAWYGGDLDDGSSDDDGAEKVLSATSSVGKKLDIWVDTTRGIGWFRGTFDHTVSNLQTSEDTKKPTMPMSGVVIDQGASGWKIAALVLTQPIADRKLVETAAKGKLVPATGAPKVTGDAALAKAATEWFATGFASKSVVGAKLSAIGTAPGESQTGAGVAKLVKAWDGLALGPTSIDARVYAKGTIGFVRAETLMPLKKGGRALPPEMKKAAPLVLGAIALNDGTSWKWVSLQFATPIGVVRPGPPDR